MLLFFSAFGAMPARLWPMMDFQSGNRFVKICTVMMQGKNTFFFISTLWPLPEDWTALPVVLLQVIWGLYGGHCFWETFWAEKGSEEL
jgi:hypothetical protein